MTENEIKNLAKAVFDEGTKSVKKQMDDSAAAVQAEIKDVSGKLAALEEKAALVDELAEKVSALEAAPADGVQLVKADLGRFMGADLNEAAELLRQKGLFKDGGEEGRQKAGLTAKWAVAAVKSMALKNPSVYAEFCKAANVEGTDANGGYLVPAVLAQELIKAARENSFALRECTVFTQNAAEVNFPAEDALVSASFVGEGSAAAASDPTFKQVAVKAQKAVALTTGVSAELLQDSVVSFVGILADQMTYAIAQLVDKTVLNGIASDTDNFQGTFADLSYDDLSDLITLLADGDRAQAKFALSRYGLGLVRKVKSSDGVPLFASAVSGEPATSLGVPYFTTENAPGASDAATVSKNVLAVGNWKKYYIGIMPGAMALEADPYSSFDKDLVRYRMKLRVGGNPVSKSAFAVLKTGAAAS